MDAHLTAETLDRARRRIVDELWEQADLNCDLFEDFAEEKLSTYAALAVEAERERLRAVLTTPVADAVILHRLGLALHAEDRHEPA